MGFLNQQTSLGGAHIVCYGCIYIRKWRAKAAKELQYELSFPHSRADKQS